MLENPKLRKYELNEISNIKVHGRTTGCMAPLTLFWTGSGMELNISGTELWIEVEADYSVYEPWISILVNNAVVSRRMITAGRYYICIFRRMNEDTVKNIRIIKDVQPMNGDPDCYLQILSIKTDGVLFPVQDKPYKIEFIGDSITSGEGAIGAKIEKDWIPMWFSGVNNYAAITADALNAELRIISQSGWGVLTSWDNNPRFNIPEYYEKICGILTGPHNEILGAQKTNDFNSWQPDIIVINLGGNDASAFRNSEEKDTWDFQKAVINFLSKLRNYNKKAIIIWAFGMMDLAYAMEPLIRQAIGVYLGQTGDNRIACVRLPNSTEETIGARQHPGKPSHENAAKVLTEFIGKLLLSW